MEVKIKQVSNGYIITWEDDYLDGEGKVTQEMLFIDDDMYEVGDRCFSPVMKMFDFVMELLGIYGSKHNIKHNPVMKCTCEGKSWYEELQEEEDVETN